MSWPTRVVSTSVPLPASSTQNDGNARSASRLASHGFTFAPDETRGDVTARGTGDEDLDETLEETFPASDAPANTVETGILVAAAPDVSDVIDHRENAIRSDDRWRNGRVVLRTHAALARARPHRSA